MRPEDLTLTTLDELLSSLLEREKPDDPWAEVMGLPQRTVSYQRLARQLGPRYERATLANYEIYEHRAPTDRMSQADAVVAVERFCEKMPAMLREGGGIVFYGLPGTGKDHLMAACLYWAILRHGFRVMWWDGLTLAQTVRDRVGTEQREKDFLEAFLAPQILAISDPIPPKGDASQFHTDTVLRIVDRRYRACKSTWATINVRDGREAEQRLAVPVIDRLRHGSLTLQCQWESYRKRPNAPR